MQFVSPKECNWIPALPCLAPKSAYTHAIIRSPHSNGTRSSTERAGPRAEGRGPLRPLSFSLCRPVEWMMDWNPDPLFDSITISKKNGTAISKALGIQPLCTNSDSTPKILRLTHAGQCSLAVDFLISLFLAYLNHGYQAHKYYLYKQFTQWPGGHRWTRKVFRLLALTMQSDGRIDNQRLLTVKWVSMSGWKSGRVL